MPYSLPVAVEPRTAVLGQSDDAKGVCDLDTLVDRCLSDAALAAKLLKRFDDRLPKVIDEIERCVMGRNWAEVAKLAHSLKGEAGSLAAHRLQRAAGELENCVRAASGDVSRSSAALAAAAAQCREWIPLFLAALTRVTDSR